MKQEIKRFCKELIDAANNQNESYDYVYKVEFDVENSNPTTKEVMESLIKTLTELDEFSMILEDYNVTSDDYTFAFDVEGLNSFMCYFFNDPVEDFFTSSTEIDITYYLVFKDCSIKVTIDYYLDGGHLTYKNFEFIEESKVIKEFDYDLPKFNVIENRE